MELTTITQGAVDGVPRDIDRLNPIGVNDDHRGTITGFAPPGDPHRVLNPDAENAISLHVGGTGLSRAGSSAHRYDEPADSEGQQ